MKKQIVGVCVLALGVALSVRAEAPYDFRRKLSAVHVPNLRDADARCAPGEVSLEKGVTVVLPSESDALIRYVAGDFADFLSVSMGVRASVTNGAAASGFVLSVRLDPSLEERRYRIKTTREGVTLVARESRALAQAFYRLEDRMGLRGGPFLRIGTESRRPRFAVRMAHSGWAEDVFPDVHLAQMAHRGLTAIVVYLSDVDRTKGLERQDVADLIRRAARQGLDTYLYAHLDVFAHPRDPGGRETLDAAYGALAARYREAKGIVFVGESAQFPTKDERAAPYRWQDRKLLAEKRKRGDRRPLAGWFPCRDYPEWLDAVKARAPGMEVVLWSYNWGSANKSDRLALIDALPKDVPLMATFEMFERHMKRNGLEAGTSDYSLSFAGPGRYFSSEAEEAKRIGRRLYAQANSAGRTWDFGTAPYQPAPWQWNRRWTAMVKAHDDWGLSGVMECHHYGWTPTFLAELEKEVYTEGGIPFDEHLRKIAARDFGADNAERVIGVWKTWSRDINDYSPSDMNQYGTFRIGPAYPFTFGGPVVANKDFPGMRHASNWPADICRMDYLKEGYVPQLTPERMDNEFLLKEVELLEPMAENLAAGERVFRAIAAGAEGQACHQCQYPCNHSFFHLSAKTLSTCDVAQSPFRSRRFLRCR